MKKFITATALAAFVIASGTAMAEDSKKDTTLQKSPTEQQMETQATGGANMKAKTPVGTTGMKAGASTNMNANVKAGDSTLPQKPADGVKNNTGK